VSARWQRRAVSAGTATRLGSSDVTVRNDLLPMDFGGELATASWAGGLTWRAPLGTLKLHATGEGAVPARGMVIGLRDTHYRDTTDAHGDVVITKLLPGPYSVEVWDPRMLEAGIGIPTAINFTAARDSTYTVTNLFPMSPEDFVTKRCGDEGQGTAGQIRLILGRVVSSNGDPVNGAKINFAIKSVTRFNALRGGYQTGVDGTFVLCTPNVNIGSTVKISVLRENLEPVDTVIVPLAKLTVLRVRVPAAP
jgi:hypothetical protein